MDLLFLPLTYFYYELLFNRSTLNVLSVRSVITMLFFSIFYGLIAVIASFWIKNRKVKYPVQGVLLFAPALICLIEYFVFRQFKVLYDLKTVMNGAGGAVGEFGHEIRAMVFSFTGILYILLFLLPTAAYIGIRVYQYKQAKKKAASKKAPLAKDGPEKGDLLERFLALPIISKIPFLKKEKLYSRFICIGTLIVFFYLLAILTVKTGKTTAAFYDEQYNFELAVQNFGFFTGLRKEISGASSKADEELDFVDVGDMTFPSMPDMSNIPMPSVVDPNGTPTSETALVINIPIGGETEPGTEQGEPSPEPGTTDETGPDVNTDPATDPAPVTDPVPETPPADTAPTDPAPTPAPPTDPAPVIVNPTPVDYGSSMLGIDFASLAVNDVDPYKALHNYCAMLTPSKKNAYTGLFKGKNLIFITAEAFTAEAIRPDITPTLYRLATKGINFNDYYQFSSAGTTGGEYENIFGMLPTQGGSSFIMTAKYKNYFTISAQLNRLGYYGKAYHNNTYTYYDRHLTHNNLNFSDGFMGYGNGMEKYVTKTWPESDYEMMVGTVEEYINKQPFSIYYMSVSGHGSYTSNNAMSNKNLSRVQNLPYSDTIKAYYAANLELEDALTYLVNRLEQAGIADNTVIVIGADHFPYSLDKEGSLGNMPLLSELYGYNVGNIFQRDHNRLIIWSGSLEKSSPIAVNSPTSSIDILPTLCNLFGVAWDSRLHPGRDVFSDAMPLAFDLAGDWKTDYGFYFAGTGQFVPIGNAAVPDGYAAAVTAIVRNKLSFCKGALNYGYWSHLVDIGAV